MGCFFTFSLELLAAQKVLILMKSNFFLFVAHAFDVVSKKPLPKVKIYSYIFF